jgi:hypothetical protein
MDKLISCPSCNLVFEQNLPNLSPTEAAQLKAANNDIGVIIYCPECRGEIRLLQRELPDLPSPR